MEKRKFGSTGLAVSPLGFGGAPIGFLETERHEVTRILNTLLDGGVSLLDTAAMYGGSEDLIGEAVSHRRDEFVLVSKCGQAQEGCDAPAWSRDVVAFTVDRALRRLRTDHLDVMLLHSCGRNELEKGEALQTLLEAREAGKIRFPGYSGDNETVAFAAGLEGIAVIQTSVNIADQHNIDMLLPKAQKQGLGVMAKRPIANAAWKAYSEQPGLYGSYAATYTERLGKMALNPVALGFSGPQDWPEIALRFTLSQPGLHVAIIGTTNADHVKANLAAVEKGPLPEAAFAQIRKAFRNADPDGQWVGQT